MSIDHKEIITHIGKSKLGSELETLIEAIDERTNDPDQFLSITELERMWSRSMSNTSQIYSNALSDAISSIDESELIKRKKANSPERG